MSKKLTKTELLALKAVVFGCNTNRKCKNGVFVIFNDAANKDYGLKAEIYFEDALRIMFNLIEQEEKDEQSNNN